MSPFSIVPLKFDFEHHESDRVTCLWYIQLPSTFSRLANVDSIPCHLADSMTLQIEHHSGFGALLMSGDKEVRSVGS
jgi:hypothetical protein